MADDKLQSLRRLAKRYRIRFRLPSEPWPEAHTATFTNIKRLGSYKFDTYSEAVNIRSADEPWTQQTKARAEWLANRAERLFGQERNEAGWRFGLENDVLRRFSVEVACPRCRARVWKSEIQATLNEDDGYAQRLDERRKQRKTCQCPPGKPPHDFYEIGTNALFDDRAEEFVTYDNLVKSELHKQKPDRVFGLQNTRNFENLLSSPVTPALAKRPGDTVSDLLRTTPFKSQTDPLLFPFLLLEAKSETSSNGFDEIQVQSAFPIWALLKLQEDLHSHNAEGEQAFDPLLWFLASQGDAWRVYGCYLTAGEYGEPTKYDIILLWTGSLMHKDHALQLILIVDYIMDWARDIYRLAILTQLKSMVTGLSFDQISLTGSDIFSMRRDVSNWIPAPPSTVFDDPEETSRDVSDNSLSKVSLDHQAMLQVQIPNTELGSVRSASLSDFRFVCLYLTETLVPSLLQLIGGRHESQSNTEKAARQIINFLTQFDEILVLSKADLDLLETLWTGVTRSDHVASTEEFYVVMEASWYLSTSWEITREISCLAVSRSAFNLLKTYADFRVRHKGIDSLPKAERICSTSVLRQCIECLRSGSPWQALLAAISCTLVTIYLLPERRRADFTPPVEVLGFGHMRCDRVRPFILKFLRLNLWKPRKSTTVSAEVMQETLLYGLTPNEVLARKREPPPNPAALSFKRISEERTCVLDEDSMHNCDYCNRCARSAERKISSFSHGFLDTRIQPLLSDYNTILVVSLQDASKHNRPLRTDLCLYALGTLKEVRDNGALSILIEGMIQTKLVYHTIKHGTEDTPWRSALNRNLPLPYRSISNTERARLKNWIRELQAKPTRPDLGGSEREWDHTHIIMYLLSIGHSEHEARCVLDHYRDRNGDQPWRGWNYDSVRERIERIEKENGKPSPYENSNPFSQIKLKLRGDVCAPGFKSWAEGREFLKREYPAQFVKVMSLTGANGNE